MNAPPYSFPPQGPASFGPPPAPPPRPKSGAGTVVIVIAILGVVAFVVVPVFAVLAIYGVRKYIANAKTAEAKNAVAQIARDAAATYEEPLAGSARHLCSSASVPVPRDSGLIRGLKYMSSSDEWRVDAASGGGFACLGFSMSQPQYYQYKYDATGASFDAVARGDLNGDGDLSRFSLKGRVVDGHVVIAPSIEETSPQE